MRELNSLIENGYAVKRAYGGATTIHLKHCARAALEEDKPDTVIINAGTNNFTKTNYTIEETAADIHEIVEIFKEGGVRNIFVSSITCPLLHQRKVDGVNRILQEYAGHHDYVFIDNACIRERHLKGDGTHLNKDGVIILANNFLSHLNLPSVSLPFHSIWD